MIRNYIKIAFRNLYRNKFFSIITIMGVTLGMAACLILFKYINIELNYDNFHNNKSSIYRVAYKYYKNGELKINSAKSLPALGRAMSMDLPEVGGYCRIYKWNCFISYEDVKFNDQTTIYADTSFFNIFSYPLLKGNSNTVLKEINTVAISQTASRKYFGNEDPIGKVINIFGTIPCIVKGVFYDLPGNTHMEFDFVLPYKMFVNFYGVEMENGWDYNYVYNYVKLKNGIKKDAVELKLDHFLRKYRKDLEKDGVKVELELQSLTNIHLDSNLQEELKENGNRQTIYFLTLVAIIILIIAWINFINLSTARAMDRAKEVGIRKVSGAFKWQLIKQFIIESFIINTIAVTLSFILVIFLIPYFNQLIEVDLNMKFRGWFWSILAYIILFVFGAIVSGIYPAYVLSSFKPSLILKGSFIDSKRGSLFKKALVGFQYTITFILLVSTIVVYLQLKKMKNQDLGFNKEQVLVVKAPRVVNDSIYNSNKVAFVHNLLKESICKSVAESNLVPGIENNNYYMNSFSRPGKDPNDNKIYYINWVDYEFIPTYEIEIIKGRNFSRDFISDKDAMIIDEGSLTLLGFENPDEAVGSLVLFEGKRLNVIGVMKNFRQRSFNLAYEPTIFLMNGNIRDYYSIRLNTSDIVSVIKKIKLQWEIVFYDSPFDYFFLDDFFDTQYKSEQKLSKIFTIFSILAILIACLGIYGLVYFDNMKRKKSIAIRKVLGSGVNKILYIVFKYYLRIILIAFIFSSVVNYYILNNWLDGYSVRIGFSVWMFIGPFFLIVVISFLTVSINTIKVAMANPAKALKDE